MEATLGKWGSSPALRLAHRSVERSRIPGYMSLKPMPTR